jgi:endonuclease/exonuclease/phosphatase family metal-dependent hydrolase
VTIIPKSIGRQYRGRTGQIFPDQTGPRFTGDHSRPGRPEAKSLRIVTFNVKFSRYVDRALRLFEKSQALQDLDILALQEMDEAGVEKIARRLGLNYVYYPAVVHSAHGKNFGNALLSPWRILEDQKIFLPHSGQIEKMQRIAVAATFKIGKRKLRAYSLHLGTALEILPRQRKHQVQSVLADAEKFSGPIIIVGDMNARGIGRFLERQGYFWATKSVRRTISLFAWDHIFIRNFEGSPRGEVGVVQDNRQASDHKPVWMVLRLDEQKGPTIPKRRSLLPGRVLPGLTLRRRKKKGSDLVSFALMMRNNISQAFSFDLHFETVCFEALPAIK